jgi:pyrimidine-nucleoside phosphorylase
MGTSILTLIEKKRDGGKLTKEEIYLFIEELVKGEVPDYQVSALLMAIYFQGMEIDEIFYLTNAMIKTGKKIEIYGLEPLVDKHSTGGVGDKVSLCLAPCMAALSVYVPMISGRSLGHTGGTVDKLESITGYRVDLKEEEFINILKKVGCSIIAPSDEIAPADKLLYALRDVTGTVPSIPLITASILSKKLSVTLDGIVFDVKTGEGAFMKTSKMATELAEYLVKITKRFGVKAKAVITDMNEPLGTTVGNRLEIIETIFYLQGAEIKDLDEVVKTLGAYMLIMGGKTDSIDVGKEMIEKVIKDRKALNKFCEMVEAHGGNKNELEFANIDAFIKVPHIEFIESEVEGYISRMNALYIGEAARLLGAGRFKKEDKIIKEAGIILHRKVGDYIKKGEKIFEIRAVDDENIEKAKDLLIASLDFSVDKPPEREIIYTVIG